MYTYIYTYLLRADCGILYTPYDYEICFTNINSQDEMWVALKIRDGSAISAVVLVWKSWSNHWNRHGNLLHAGPRQVQLTWATTCSSSKSKGSELEMSQLLGIWAWHTSIFQFLEHGTMAAKTLKPAKQSKGSTVVWTQPTLWRSQHHCCFKTDQASCRLAISPQLWKKRSWDKVGIQRNVDSFKKKNGSLKCAKCHMFCYESSHASRSPLNSLGCQKSHWHQGPSTHWLPPSSHIARWWSVDLGLGQLSVAVSPQCALCSFIV